MLVYGDRPHSRAPGEVLADLRRQLAGAEALPAGILWHTALARLLIDAGMLAQGLLDARYEQEGHDEQGPEQERALAVPLAVARALWESHRSGYFVRSALPWEALEALERASLPDAVTLKPPEGYAYYALYPEAYMEAARGLPDGRAARVIGIRSIGTSLACAVAAGAGAVLAPMTVRPGGHPFQRELRLGPGVEAALRRSERGTPFAIVDEGPGLSGSSFGAVADTLERAGVPVQQLHFFPSHGGKPGPMASEAHRVRWRRAHKHTVDFERLFLSPSEPRHALASWVEDLCGAPLTPLEDLGVGAGGANISPGRRTGPPSMSNRSGANTSCGPRGASSCSSSRGWAAAASMPSSAHGRSPRRGGGPACWGCGTASSSTAGRRSPRRSSPRASIAVSCSSGPVPIWPSGSVTSPARAGATVRAPSDCSRWGVTTRARRSARSGSGPGPVGRSSSRACRRRCTWWRPMVACIPGNGS
ncbi:hypothetical protein ACN28S_39370 [Cystobacter fuscus]